MRRYMTGMVTGTLVGAVVAGVWLLRRPRRSAAGHALYQARRWAPRAYRVARWSGSRIARVAKRRLG